MYAFINRYWVALSFIFSGLFGYWLLVAELSSVLRPLPTLIGLTCEVVALLLYVVEISRALQEYRLRFGWNGQPHPWYLKYPGYGTGGLACLLAMVLRDSWLPVVLLCAAFTLLILTTQWRSPGQRRHRY